MLRHTYTAQNQIRQLSCKDCKKRKVCVRLKKYKSTYQREKLDTCFDFIKETSNRPKVTSPEDDCREMLHQIMLSVLSAESIKNEYLEDWISPFSLVNDNTPSFSECNMFIEVLNAFKNHILEFKEMYSNCRKDLSDLIQTIIKVDGSTVMVYLEMENSGSPIKLLKERIEEVISRSSFNLEYKTYEEILDKEIPEVREENTE